MENERISDVLNRIGDLIELTNGNVFRVRSYRNASRTIRDLSERIEDLVEQGADLTDLPNIGSSLAKKILEILKRGTCRKLEELEQQVPGGLIELLRVPQLGPKKVAQLYRELAIQSLDDLRKAAEDHRIRDLSGMGDKTEQNILEGLQTLETASGRVTYHEASSYVKSFGNLLDSLKTVSQWEVAGSYRRRKETVGDLDILVQATDRQAAADDITVYDAVDRVIGRGEEKLSIQLETGLQVDLRFFDPESFGAALVYFTGSKAHNIAIRKRAQAHGWKLNEYGIFKGERRLAGRTEESVYHRLSLPWIPPELREDRGELEAAEIDKLPKLITVDDIRGDLHAHTNASDGRNTLQEMAEAARARDLEYLAITEHSKAVRVAGGLDEDALRRHVDAIRELNEHLDGFALLAGVEVDILKTGKLDLDEDLLAELDWVVASIHSHFNLHEDAMTDRVLAAVKSGVVNCLGHLLTRLIGSRDSIALDLDRVFESCHENRVCIEINSQPDRMDLPDIHCRRARDFGVRFAVATDAHRTLELDFIQYGVLVARRAWLEKGDVVNTMPRGKLMNYLAECS